MRIGQLFEPKFVMHPAELLFRHRQFLAENERRAERLADRTLSKAEHLLSKPAHWRAVERLAAELLRVGEVSGRAARHFFDEARKED